MTTKKTAKILNYKTKNMCENKKFEVGDILKNKNPYEGEPYKLIVGLEDNYYKCAFNTDIEFKDETFNGFMMVAFEDTNSFQKVSKLKVRTRVTYKLIN